MINGNEEIPESELQWTDEPIIGLTLMIGGKDMIDSEQNPINPGAYYNVAKHLPTGMLVIVPVDDKSTVFDKWLAIGNRLN